MDIERIIKVDGKPISSIRIGSANPTNNFKCEVCFNMYDDMIFDDTMSEKDQIKIVVDRVRGILDQIEFGSNKPNN